MKRIFLGFLVILLILVLLTLIILLSCAFIYIGKKYGPMSWLAVISLPTFWFLGPLFEEV